MKPTSAQQWLAHSLEGLATMAALTAAINIYTAFQAGNLTLSSAGIIAATAFLTILSKGAAGLLSNPQTIQAAQDSLKQLQDAMTALLSSHQTLLAAMTTQVVQAQQPVQKEPAPIVLQQPLNQGTIPVQPPMLVPSPQQPLYMPNLSATGTAAPLPSTFVQSFNPATSASGTLPWVPPSPDVHFGDSQIVPVVPKQ